MLTDEEILLRLIRGELWEAPMHFNEIMHKIREPDENGAWPSYKELVEIMGFTENSIFGWCKKTKAIEPSWSNAILALRRLGIVVVLLPQEETLMQKLRGE